MVSRIGSHGDTNRIYSLQCLLLQADGVVVFWVPWKKTRQTYEKMLCLGSTKTLNKDVH
jgi:hypothetical protein